MQEKIKMNNQKNENLKKITISLVVLAMLGVSHYYYSDSGCEKKQVKKPAQIAMKKEAKEIKKEKDVKKETKTDKKEQKPEKPEEKTPAIQPEQPKKPEQKPVQLKGIKPTSKKDILANASGIAGKNDPFSYTESNFIPLSLSSQSASGKRTGSLPSPPRSSDYSPGTPSETVVIKGFIGNKVIAQIKGLTESLGANESLQGIKVVSVDPANRSCVFVVDGKKVTKTMKPINPENNKIELNYINNQ